MNKLHTIVTQNINGRIIFIGDIHGHASIIESILDAYNFDPAVDQVICVGDLIDRGPDSLACLRYTKFDWFNACLGNHEDTLLKFNEAPNRALEKQWREKNGGEWWFSNKLTSAERYESIDLCRSMPTAITAKLANGKRFGVVHSSCPLTNWDRFIENLSDPTFKHHALTSRYNVERGIHHFVDDLDIVVVGHTPNKNMMILGNTVHIDTGMHTHKNRMLPALDNNELTNLHKLLLAPHHNNAAKVADHELTYENDNTHEFSIDFSGTHNSLKL